MIHTTAALNLSIYDSRFTIHGFLRFTIHGFVLRAAAVKARRTKDFDCRTRGRGPGAVLIRHQPKRAETRVKGGAGRFGN